MLKNKRIAALITDGYHHGELTGTMKALTDEGATVTVVSLKPEHLSAGVLDHITYKLPDEMKPKERLKADRLIGAVAAAEFDALFIPGGHSPGTLRVTPEALKLTLDFYAQRKPIATLCRGPQVLISAGIVNGKDMTSAGSVADDLKNAGAIFLNLPLVVDGNIITSRSMEDLDQFNKALIDALNS